MSKNISQFGDANVSQPKFIRTFSESKNIFVLEQKAIVLSFVKMLRFYWNSQYIRFLDEHTIHELNE